MKYDLDLLQVVEQNQVEDPLAMSIANMIMSRWWFFSFKMSPLILMNRTIASIVTSFFLLSNFTFDRDEKINSFHCDLLFQTGLSDGRPAWLGSLQLWRTCQVRLLRFLWLYFCLIFAKYLNFQSNKDAGADEEVAGQHVSLRHEQS